jgi:hypothetical protein
VAGGVTNVACNRLLTVAISRSPITHIAILICEISVPQRFTESYWSAIDLSTTFTVLTRVHTFAREVAADLGYTKLMMWSGTLGDSGHISLAREYTFGKRYMNNGTVLLGHANNMNADKLFERLYRVTTSRNLEMVTLQDAMGPTFRPDPAPVSPSASPSPIL